MFASSQILGAPELFWEGLRLNLFSTTASQSLGKVAVAPPSESHLAVADEQSFGSLTVGSSRRQLATASAHTLLDSWRLVTLVEVAEEVNSKPESTLLSVSEVLEEITDLTGLKKARIARSLFGVSRTAFSNWLKDMPISAEHEERVRSTFAVLQLASRRHPNQESLRGWLFTPVGSRAIPPLDLLKAGEMDEARMLALAMLPTRQAPYPDWLLSSPIDKWAEGDQELRDNITLESDATSDGRRGN